MEKIIRRIIKDTIKEITVSIKWDRYTEYETEDTGFVINLFGWIKRTYKEKIMIKEDFVIFRFTGSVEPLMLGYEYTTSSVRHCDQIAKDLGFTKETHHLCNKWEK